MDLNTIYCTFLGISALAKQAFKQFWGQWSVLGLILIMSSRGIQLRIWLWCGKTGHVLNEVDFHHYSMFSVLSALEKGVAEL